MSILKSKFCIFILLCFLIYWGGTLSSCRKAQPYEENDQEWLPGGSATSFDVGASAFGHSISGMSLKDLETHGIGDGAFGASFVTAPAPRFQGLGPVYNNVSCVSCHIGDGRARPPLNEGESFGGLFLRISLPGENEHGGPAAVPGYGIQLQHKSVFGKFSEASVSVTYTDKAYNFDDGAVYKLRTPQYNISNTYTSWPAGVLLSPRMAPPIFGLGLLEGISESDILAHADPDDRDNDGISGKPNYVWDVTSAAFKLGRFGWKANNPTILQQTAGAYSEDMGITTSVFPSESSWGQPQYDGLNDDPELPDSILQATTFYIRTLAVPVRRDLDQPEVQRGKALFAKIKCGACHIPSMRTAVNVTLPQISNQLIFPYTDLLLHDMGEDLADNRPDFKADGREWRTPPLWGIGLTAKVNGHTFFLHDGRARSVEEAILWHGGEAQHSKEAYRMLNADERKDLLKFLDSL